MGQQIPDSDKITFGCTSCGAKLAVSRTLAGKQGRCPKCRQTVTVPAPPTPDVTTSRSPLYDLRLLDVSTNTSLPASTGESDDVGAAYRQLQMLPGARLPGRQDDAPSRK